MDTYNTIEKVHNRGVEAVGKTIGELAANMPAKKSGKKSSVGDAWESWFLVDKNSNKYADLIETGIELKATPIKYLKNGNVSAKERLVLNIINYIEEFDTEFENSSFWKKNQIMELGFYYPDPKLEKKDWLLLKSVLFQYPKKDLLIIKQDWEKIHDFIKQGKAHELTEGATMYLGACTKGKNKSSIRSQHPSLNAPEAKQRAYSLKSKYMTYLLREYIFGENEDPNIRVKPFNHQDLIDHEASYSTHESIVSDINILENMTLESYINQTLQPYINKSTKELSEEFEIQSKSKSLNASLINRMLGLHGDLETSEEFSKANITVKTIRVTKKNKIVESMSFPTFKFKELVIEDWESSELHTLLEETKFFFAIFKETDDGNYVFKGAKFWSMPASDLENTVKSAWEDTVRTLKNGVILEYKGNRVTNNFISKSDGRIIHVRPHAQKSSYLPNNINSDQLPVPAKWINKPEDFSDEFMTKQCFWLNNDYILKQISDILD